MQIIKIIESVSGKTTLGFIYELSCDMGFAFVHSPSNIFKDGFTSASDAYDAYMEFANTYAEEMFGWQSSVMLYVLEHCTALSQYFRKG